MKLTFRGVLVDEDIHFDSVCFFQIISLEFVLSCFSSWLENMALLSTAPDSIAWLAQVEQTNKTSATPR